MSEIERIRRVASMMITAHSILRDKYLTHSAFFENGLLIASAFLNAFVFIDEQLITQTIGISSSNQKLFIGFLSITVFAISIVLLQVRWKEKAKGHAIAADQYYSLMQESRRIISLADEANRNVVSCKFIEKYAEVTSTLAKIPERKFNGLKLQHYRKIELSKLIDKHPGSVLFILRIKLFIASFKEKNKNEFL